MTLWVFRMEWSGRWDAWKTLPNIASFEDRLRQPSSLECWGPLEARTSLHVTARKWECQPYGLMESVSRWRFQEGLLSPASGTSAWKDLCWPVTHRTSRARRACPTFNRQLKRAADNSSEWAEQPLLCGTSLFGNMDQQQKVRHFLENEQSDLVISRKTT